jgi:hypothetical protein
MLDGICESAGSRCKKDALYGNHEARALAFLEEDDNGKLGEELKQPDEALRLEERGFSVHRDWKEDSVKVGPYLEVIHGVYLGDNTAKKHLTEVQGSCVFGHSHRVQSYVSGKRGAYNIGHLGDSDSDGFRYMNRWSRQRWVNAFAVINLLDDGSFLVNTVNCWKNRFVLNGKAY